MVKSFKTNILTWLKTKTYIKTEIDNFLNGKSDTNHTHTNASTTTPGFLSKEDKTKLNNLKQITVDSTINATSSNPVQNKVINTALTKKANTNHTHSITNITNLQSQLDKKANSVHTHDDRYYTETEMNTKLDGKADINHNHDNKYSLLTHHHTGLDGIPDIICNSSGQQSVTGYRKVFRLKITKQYFDSPVSFEFVQRKCRQTARVHIIFNSVVSNDPSLRAFTYEGGIETPIYLYKESASTWVFIIKEQSTYDTVNVRFLPLSSSIKNSCTITPMNEYLSTLPNSDIYTCSVLIPKHNHSISNVTGLQSKLDTIPSLTSTSITVSGADNQGTITFYKFGKIVVMELDLSKVHLTSSWNVVGTLPNGYMPKLSDGAGSSDVWWSVQGKQGQSAQLNIKETGEIRFAYGNGQTLPLHTYVTYIVN